MSEGLGGAEAGAIAAGVASMVGLLFRSLIGREVSRVDETLKSHNQRLRDVEASTSQTEATLGGVKDSIAQLRDAGEAQHRERMDELRRVHERLDTLMERHR